MKKETIWGLLLLAPSRGDRYLGMTAAMTQVPVPTASYDYVRAYADTYDFDMKSWGNPLNWVRNAETIVGKKVAGEGIPYIINIYGSKQLKPLFLWTR